MQDTTHLSGNINELTAEFRTRTEEFLETVDLRDHEATNESLARWLSEEFSKLLVEREEEAWEGYSQDPLLDPDDDVDDVD